MRPNILLTSPGPDGQLASAFQRELHSLLPQGKALTANVRPGCAAYAPQLLEVCASNDIGLLIPTGDMELAVLARHRRDFAKEEVAIAVSDPQFVDVAGDKHRLMGWFRGRGLQTPRTINSRSDATFPIVAVPSNSSGGREAVVVSDARQFASLLLDDPQLMFVEYLSPSEFEECTIDMCYSEDGALKSAMSRHEAVVAGRAGTSPAVACVRERFEKIPGARGCITMRLCVHGRTEAVYGIDIKARLDEDQSYESASNLARCLIQEYLLSRPAGSSHRRAA